MRRAGGRCPIAPWTCGRRCTRRSWPCPPLRRCALMPRVPAPTAPSPALHTSSQTPATDAFRSRATPQYLPRGITGTSEGNRPCAAAWGRREAATRPLSSAPLDQRIDHWNSAQRTGTAKPGLFCVNTPNRTPPPPSRRGSHARWPPGGVWRPPESDTAPAQPDDLLLIELHTCLCSFD